MKKSGKIILGFITLWPIIYVILFITFICVIIFLPIVNELSESNDINIFTALIFILHGLTIFTMFGLIVFYFIHAMMNQKLEGLEKVTWIIVIVMVGVITMPIYWYVHIWKEGSKKLFRIKSKQA